MGLGIEACGRSFCGDAASDIEPRFEYSRPIDHSLNNSTTIILKFSTYCFSSWLSSDDCVIEISEDAGASYNVAYTGFAFLAPYNGTASKVRRPDSQRLVFYIEKVVPWPVHRKIKIRLTGIDDFGQLASKMLPVTWD
jgi:hypothetical protein